MQSINTGHVQAMRTEPCRCSNGDCHGLQRHLTGDGHQRPLTGAQTFAFGQAGWGVQGWEDIGGIPIPERAGFSFSMLEEGPEEAVHDEMPPSKRARH